MLVPFEERFHDWSLNFSLNIHVCDAVVGAAMYSIVLETIG